MATHLQIMTPSHDRRDSCAIFRPQGRLWPDGLSRPQHWPAALSLTVTSKQRGFNSLHQRVCPMPNLTMEGGGLERRTGRIWFRVHAAGCVCCGQWKTPGPGSEFLRVFEERRLSQWICWWGTELVPSRSPLFLSIQGHCCGPEDQLCAEACRRRRVASWTIEDMQSFTTGDV